MMNKFFFDSYAIIEILKGSESYQKYANAEFVITKLNLFEVYYRMLQDSQEKADLFLSAYAQHAVDFDETVIAEACKFRLENKRNSFSMADCIGYILALKNSLKFLAGDMQFKTMPKVEFAK